MKDRTINIDETLLGHVYVSEVLYEFDNKELNDFIKEQKINVEKCVEVDCCIDTDVEVDDDLEGYDTNDLLDELKHRDHNGYDTALLTDKLWWLKRHYDKNDPKFEEVFDSLCHDLDVEI